MKNSANALAPAAVCLVASIGITGGFSPSFAFGPVVGTSGGTVGVAGTVVDGGAAAELDVELVGLGVDVAGADDPFWPAPELVQPATPTSTIATIAR